MDPVLNINTAIWKKQHNEIAVARSMVLSLTPDVTGNNSLLCDVDLLARISRNACVLY